MKNIITFFFGVLIVSAIFWNYAKAVNPRTLLIIQGGTSTSTAQANAVWFGGSGGTNGYFTQDGNFTYATSSDTLTLSNLTVWGTCTGCGAGGGTAWATTSSDYWFTQQTTAGLAENTNLYYTSSRDIKYSTTSADYWMTSTTTLPSITTLANLNYFSTTSANAFIIASSTIPNLKCSTGLILESSGTGWSCGTDDTGTGGGWATTSSDFWITSTTTLPSITTLTGLTAIGKASATTTITGGFAVGTNLNLFENGNVGIGTTTPTGRLSVQASSTSAVLAVRQVDSANQGNIAEFYDGTNPAFVINNLGTISTGTWGGSQIDFSSYINATAGEGINFTGDSISAKFGTTSVDYWETIQKRWATTSSDYWFTQQTTAGLAENTNLYYTSSRDIKYSTTSADYWMTSTTTLPSITTLANLNYFSTTSANAFIIASSTIPNLKCSTGLILESSGTGWSCGTDDTGSGGGFSTTSADYWITSTTTLPSISKLSNLNYYSTTSADAWLAVKSTTNLSEGTNLYYTSGRDIKFSTTSADVYIIASTTIPNIKCGSGLILESDGTNWDCGTDDTGTGTYSFTPTTIDALAFTATTSRLTLNGGNLVSFLIGTTTDLGINGLTPLMAITNTSANLDDSTPMLWIKSTDSGGGNADIRIDSPAPDIEFIEIDQTSPNGKFEIGVGSDAFYIASRNGANNSFERGIIEFARYADGGMVGLNTPFDTKFLDSVLTVAATSSLGHIFDVSSLAASGGDYFNITTAGKVGIGTTSPYAKLSVNGQIVSSYFTATSTKATSTFPNLSSTKLAVTGLTNCNTLDTDGDGLLKCGSDETGASTAAWATTSSDYWITSTTTLPSITKDFTVVLASSTLAYNGSYGANGTTTLEMGASKNKETFTDIWCKTDIGTTTIAWSDKENNDMDFIPCNHAGTEDDGTIANNKYTVRETKYLKVGTNIGSPNRITITTTKNGY